MTTAAERNQQKQRKNAKRGGYAPSIAKDVNKHKVQKVQRYVKDLEKESVEVIEADLFDKGYKRALADVANELRGML